MDFKIGESDLKDRKHVSFLTQSLSLRCVTKTLFEVQLWWFKSHNGKSWFEFTARRTKIAELEGEAGSQMSSSVCKTLHS